MLEMMRMRKRVKKMSKKNVSLNDKTGYNVLFDILSCILKLWIDQSINVLVFSSENNICIDCWMLIHNGCIYINYMTHNKYISNTYLIHNRYVYDVQQIRIRCTTDTYTIHIHYTTDMHTIHIQHAYSVHMICIRYGNSWATVKCTHGHPPFRQ